MSKVPENTLEIIEKNIQSLKERGELSIQDIKRLETLVNIRKIIIANGTETVHVIHKHENIPDSEILAALKEPRKPVAKKAPKKKAK